MKKLLLVLALSLLGSHLVLACSQMPEQNEKKRLDLTLCGQVKEILLKKGGDALKHASAIINFQLTNKGSEIIFIIPERIKVLGGTARLKDGTFFASYGAYGSGGFKSLERTSAMYNKPSPIIEGVQIINPGETLGFSGSLSLELDRADTNPQASWTSISQNSPVFLNAKIETVDSYLEKNGKVEKGQVFWKTLHDKWRGVGYLWLDEIVSEPILLDIGSTIVKTEIL